MPFSQIFLIPILDSMPNIITFLSTYIFFPNTKEKKELAYTETDSIQFSCAAQDIAWPIIGAQKYMLTEWTSGRYRGNLKS